MTSELEDILVAGMMFLGMGAVVGWAGTYLWYGMKRIRELKASPLLPPGPLKMPDGPAQGAVLPKETAEKHLAPAVVHGKGWVLIQWHCHQCGRDGQECRCPVNVYSCEM